MFPRKVQSIQTNFHERARSPGSEPEILPTAIEKGPLSDSELRSVFVGIMLAMLLASIDQTIVGPALPTIGRTLGDVENLFWVVNAYLLTGTAVIPLYGKLSDIHGRRIVLMVGIYIFMAGSLACALAPNLPFLILGRAFQGIGGGGLISLVQTITADIVAPRERGRYMGYFVSVSAASSIGGPLLGGLLTQYLHWSLIFWINLPLGLIALLSTAGALKRLPDHSRKHSLDILGAGLMMVASLALMLALTWGGIRYPWFSLPIASLVVGSAVLWVLFTWRLKTAEEPFLPLSVLANSVVRNAVISRGCGQGVLVGLTIFAPLYFEVVRHLSISQSGLVLITLLAGTMVSSQLTGRLIVNVERYKLFPLVGLPVAVVAMLAFAIWPTSLPLSVMFALLSVVGMGIGSMLPVSTVVTQNAVVFTDIGVATSALNFSRSFGSALVVALFGTIILGGTAGPGEISAASLSHSAAGDLTLAFRYLFVAGAVILAISFVSFAAVEERPLRADMPSAHGTAED
jgi:MFS family permease